MTEKENLMFDIYNSLVQLRYPKISTATIDDVESVILKQNNRISLLSWLLTKISPSIAVELEKLDGLILEDKLFEHYSGIGVCSDKQLLLGNCTWQEQYSTLKLLLDFINYVHVKSSSVDPVQDERTNDVLRAYIESSNAITSNDKSISSYFESVQYFDNLKKFVDEHEESIVGFGSEKEQRTAENGAQQMGEENEGKENDDDTYLSFDAKTKKFVETFSTVASRISANVNGENNNLRTMQDCIMDTSLNFSSVKKFLEAREEISNSAIPNGLNTMTLPLTESVVNIVSSSEDVLGTYKT